MCAGNIYTKRVRECQQRKLLITILSLRFEYRQNLRPAVILGTKKFRSVAEVQVWDSSDDRPYAALLLFITFAISLAAFAPEPPVNPAPGCVPEPHKNKFLIGVW